MNVPYDDGFEPLYLAYVVGLTALQVRVRCTLDLPKGERLNRIMDLIASCDVSIHDLSRVGGLARFNMPIELGIALYHRRCSHGRHGIYIFERERYRLQKTASDCNLLDPQIHGGTIGGVMQELRNIFYQKHDSLTVPQMLKVLRVVRRRLPILQRNAGGASMYSAALFGDIVLAASRESRRIATF